jgi:hypothetical protein
MIIAVHELTATQYDNIWERCVSAYRCEPAYDLIKKYIKNTFNGDFHNDTKYGTIMFYLEKDYNWFLLNV